MRSLLAAALLCGLLTACSVGSGARAAGAEVEPVGRGVVRVSAEAPADAEVWQRPLWRVGDQFTLVRGDRMTGTFTVRSNDGGVYVIDMGNGSLLRRDQDLGNLGHWRDSEEEAERAMLPADARYHWPLWVGKQWTCDFVDRARTGKPLRMSASYEVEAIDHVNVPAGSYEALRISRRLRLVDGRADVLTRAQMIWYAPDAGLEVRQLIGDTLVELVSYKRGQSSDQ